MRQIIEGQSTFIEDRFVEPNGELFDLRGRVVVYRIGDGESFSIVKRSDTEPPGVTIHADEGATRCWLTTAEVARISSKGRYSVYASFPPHDGSHEEIMGPEEPLEPVHVISRRSIG